MAEQSVGTVLVVDDTEVNRYVLSRLLSREGFRVLEADTASAALERLSGNPDVVILDVNLPDLKGTELAHRIRSNPATSSVMILNMSASFTRTQDRIESLEHGADGFLTQPIDPPEFIATVKSLIRIKRAEEGVRKSNRDLSNFAITVSHDLQEPLRMVSSYLGLLQRKAAPRLDAQELGYIQSAIEGANRMSFMVRDLLALASADQAEIKTDSHEVSAIVQDALTNLSLKISEAGATVTMDALPIVVGDRVLLAQVFQNMISNAIKFRGQRPVAIHISAEKSPTQVIIRIQDNGIGIAPENLDRIFGLFQRLHSAEQYPGTGIGLALCRRIIEKHHGTLGVTSRLGHGSCFWFSLPA